MTTEGTAPCPHCKAENMAHRRSCWRCKRTLPTSFALDAARRASRIGSADARPPDRADIEEALRRAIIVGGPDEEEEATPKEAGRFSKRLLWLIGKRTHA